MTIGKMETAATADGSKLIVVFDDGLEATIDLAPIIGARAALAPLADSDVFDRARLSDDGWSIEWAAVGIDFGAPQLRRWADEQAGRTMSAASFREWIRRNKLTLDRAAKELGLSRRMIAYYLSGEQPIPRTVMLATEGLEARQFA